jgi:hypothetical protein
LNRFHLVVVFGLFTGGCSQPVRPVSAAVASERLFQRNYVLGQEATAYVGQAVVRSKDYMVRKRQGSHMRPSVTFRVRQALSGWIEGRADHNYPVRSELEKDGTIYRAVALREPTDGYTAVLVAPDGRPYQKLLAKIIGQEKAVLVAGTALFDPGDVRFLPGVDEVVVDSTAGFTNYELLYGGTDGKSFTLTYREYTPHDLIKPAFTQTLTYEHSSNVVRFRDLKLQLHEVTSEQLKFSVIQDDAGAP